MFWVRTIYKHEDEGIEIIYDCKIESLGNPMEIVRVHPEKAIIVIDWGFLIDGIFISNFKKDTAQQVQKVIPCEHS